MMTRVHSVLITLNQVFEAGIAITALSLFIRALSFNLQDRVARSFAIIMACMVIVFSGEAISGTIVDQGLLAIWLRFQWLGILYIPPAILHFSDALLATTGQPSRGRRRRVIFIAYTLSTGFVGLLLFSMFLGPVVVKEGVYPHLAATPLSAGFGFYYIAAIIVSGVGIYRAFLRTKLRVSQRRIRYMLAGIMFLALGAYPYLQLGSGLAQRSPEIFTGLVFLGNIGIFWCLVLMAYAIGFFGVHWPDRVVRSRLLKWLLRGPVTVFLVLILMTGVAEVGESYGSPYSVAIPITTVLTILFMEHVITLVFPYLDRWLFHGGDHESIELLEKLSERFLTTSDLRQFLEAVLAAVCDQFQVSTGFVAALGEEGLELVVNFGREEFLQENGLEEMLLEKAAASKDNGSASLFAWGDFWLHPLYGSNKDDLLGLLGVWRSEDHNLDDGLMESLETLGERVEMALVDRRLQREIFEKLETLKPKVDFIQRLRAASRYDQSEMMTDLEPIETPKNLNRWVKDALRHYWGGPKLTRSPLMGLKVVQDALEEHQGNTANAMRAILRQAIERVRPEEGERRFTPEWILYNILEMKFMEGRKVREIAMRLAVSEADLYRKQRVAIEVVAHEIVEMEMKVRNNKAAEQQHNGDVQNDQLRNS